MFIQGPHYHNATMQYSN